jgi:hypothetical protein
LRRWSETFAEKDGKQRTTRASGKSGLAVRKSRADAVDP